MLGCAAVYTVPATNALPTCPDTLPPATAYAVFAILALGTYPVTLAPVILDNALPLPVNVFADILLAPEIFPLLPLVVILFAVILPVAFNVPDTLTPVPVTTNTFAFPTALMFTLPLLLGILTLLLPLLILEGVTDTVTQLKLPVPSVCKY